MKRSPSPNKDNQEDKEPLFDTVDTLIRACRVFTSMLGGTKVNADDA
jgi:argininosuccinate lyase